MSVLKLFYGPSPQRLEEKGDAHSAAGSWGPARLAYEGALDKYRKRSERNVEAENRLAEKIRDVSNALAREHQETAQNLIEGGHHDEAQGLLSLAAEVAADPELKTAIDAQLSAMALPRRHAGVGGPAAASVEPEEPGPLPGGLPEEDYFLALCGTLPDEVRKAYLAYSEDFKRGYTALNRGDFQAAAESLSRAMAQTPDPASYIPLELATALLNLDRAAEARGLLETFLGHHPDALPAYQLLCEVLWEEGDFDRADALLTSLPEELAHSVAAVLLKGETLFRGGRISEARDFYLQVLKQHGWLDPVARKLAEAHETLNEPAAAQTVYREIIGRCSSCHSRAEPEIKHRYAELCFADGKYTAETLEMYLALAREIPENAAHYFDRVSHIYTAQGHAGEAERFRAFAAQAAAKRD
jgi:tetratricopeptide (TPR) repeat protein